MEYENPVEFTVDNAQKCPSCKAVFTKAAKYCPHCGILLATARANAAEVAEEAGASEDTVKAGFIIRVANQQKIMLNNRPSLLIGSARYDCDYCVSNPEVSRKHLQIIKLDNSYYIKDLRSKNHTYLNKEELEPGTEYLLKDKDVIEIASEQFIFGLE